MEPKDIELLRRLGSRIGELRRAGGHTQEELAHLYGCSPRYIQLVEQGHKNVSVLVLAQFARLLGVEPRVLLDSPKTTRRNPGRPRKET